jgi:hypothetical protein
MQQRRGNRVDLPQPLRPGEIGLASDSKEVFIGLDPEIGVTKQNANGVNINNIVNGYDYASGYLNNNIVRLVLPSKRLTPGTFDSTSNSSVYTPISSSNQKHGKTVFRTSVGSQKILNVFDSETFASADVTVTKNGTLLATDSTRTTANLLSNEYIISADSNSNTANHSITFGTQPKGSDDFTITYYDNADIIAALTSNSGIGTTGFSGFYGQYFSGTHIPDNRKLNNAYILADHVTGTAFIGLEDKHLDVVAYSGTVSTPSSLTLTGNLIVTRVDTPASSYCNIALSSYSNLSSVINAVNNNSNSNSWLAAGNVDGVTDKWYLYSNDGVEFSVDETDTDLGVSNVSYTRANSTIKGKLESWLHDAVANTSFNMFTAAEVKGNLYNSSATNIGTYSNVTAVNDTLSITFTGNKEAEHFSYIANRLYFENANADVTGLTNVKSNQRLLTLDDYDVLLSGSADAGYVAQTVQVLASSTETVDVFDASVYDSVVLDYSVKSTGGSGNVYSRTGTLHITGDADLDDAALDDTGVVLQNGFSGQVDFSASMSSDIITVTATNSLTDGTARGATVKFLVRKWLG